MEEIDKVKKKEEESFRKEDREGEGYELRNRKKMKGKEWNGEGRKRKTRK